MEPVGPFPRDEEFVCMALGWLGPRTIVLELRLTQVLEVLAEPVELGTG